MGLDVSSNRDYLAASCYDKTFKLWSLSDRKDLFLNCKEEELERPAIEVVKQYKEEHLEPTIPEKKLKTENAEVEMIVEESSTNDDIVEIADQPTDVRIEASIQNEKEPEVEATIESRWGYDDMEES